MSLVQLKFIFNNPVSDLVHRDSKFAIPFGLSINIVADKRCFESVHILAAQRLKRIKVFREDARRVLESVHYRCRYDSARSAR